MKIGLFLPSLDSGGAQQQFVQLATGLSRRGHRVIVYTLIPEGRHWKELDANPGLSLVALQKRRRQGRLALGPRLLISARKLRSAICNDQPEVLYSALHLANILALLATDSGRLLPIVWGVRASHQKLPWRQALFFWICRKLSNRPDLLIYNSKAGLEDHRQMGFENPNNQIIFNGYDTARFRTNPEAGRAVRNEWGIPPEARLVGIVGRLSEVKDHATFLKAADFLGAMLPDTRFVCIGDGQPAQRRALQRLAGKTSLGDRLQWVGERHDIERALNALDALCLTSLSEACPNVLAEAMACGVPCVSTDVGDARAILGEGGEIVPVGDAHALAQALVRTLQVPEMQRSQRSAALRRHIADHYGLESMLAQTERALQTVVEARNRPDTAVIDENKGRLP